MDKKIVEILVDKTNLKGPGVFEHILIVLHKVFDDFEKKSVFSRKINIENHFSFEITKAGNRIRFFLIMPEKYKNFFVNQVYAHYNNVEILEVGDYLEAIPSDKITIGKIVQQKHQYYPIKSFTELQEEGSKDMVDPFSSITSALGRTGKYTLNTLQINFTPLTDRTWKKNAGKTIEILASNYPKWVKRFMMSKYFTMFKILLFPIYLVGKIIGLMLPTSAPDVM